MFSVEELTHAYATNGWCVLVLPTEDFDRVRRAMQRKVGVPYVISTAAERGVEHIADYPMMYVREPHA